METTESPFAVLPASAATAIFSSPRRNSIFISLRRRLTAAPAPLSITNVLQRAIFVVAFFLGFAIVEQPALTLASKSGIDPGIADAKRPSPQLFAQTPPNAQEADKKGPTLVVGRTDPKRAGEAFPLEVSARGLSGSSFAVMSGLASGTSLSVGALLGDGTWWVAAADLEHVVIQPPPRFVGAMDVAIELRLADTKICDKKSVHLEWLPVVSLDADEMAALLKRGNDLLISGDIAAAQLVLRRAAEGGSAQAAMALAGTYDPVLLAKLGVHGFSPNVALARQWYEKAKQLGSIEAARRLEMLAIKRD